MKNICFTGHRQIRNDGTLTIRLEETLRNLIEQHGATDFYSGSAIGWDTLCAKTVLKLRSTYPHIRLHLVFPCCEAEQTASWQPYQPVNISYIIYPLFNHLFHKTMKNFAKRKIKKT